MGLTLVTPPQLEPITTDEAFQHCRIDEESEEGLVAGYIIAARTYAEGVTRLALMKQTFDFTIDYLWPWMVYSTPDISPIPMWRTRIELPKAPVTAVQWIQYVDTSGNTQTLDPSQYVLRTDGPVAFIEPAFGVTWPTPRYQAACVTVRFDAGWSSIAEVPENIRLAMLMLIAYWYDNRGSAQFGARASGIVSTSSMPAESPPAVDALLSMDKRVRVAG